MSDELPQLHEISGQPSGWGGKVLGVVRLGAQRLPVLPGFVVPHKVCPSDAHLQKAILRTREQCTAMGIAFTNWIVRSSSNAEDQNDTAAPGLFLTLARIEDHGLAKAIAQVQGSAKSAAVRVYMENQHQTQPVEISVLVQPYIEPLFRGIIHTRSFLGPDELLLEVDNVQSAVSNFAQISRQPGASCDLAIPVCQWLGPVKIKRLVELAVLAESAISSQTRGADIEWLCDDHGTIWLVQARPITAPPKDQVTTAPPSFAFSREVPEQVWRWDVTHNPDPLSPAQIGLVELTKDISFLPMRVVEGYLYYGDPRKATPPANAQTVESLRSYFYDELLPLVDGLLAPLEDAEAPALAPVLAAYRQVYERYELELAPRLRATRRLAGTSRWNGQNVLLAQIARLTEGRLSKKELVRYASPLAPAWDVASPTYGEEPDRLEIAIASVLQRQENHSARHGDEAASHEQAALAKLVLDISESDDYILYRAQALVRRSLLGLAKAWDLANRDHIFFMPLSWTAEQSRQPPSDLPEKISQAQEAMTLRNAQARLAMPLSVQNGIRLERVSYGSGNVWKGVGLGGLGRGRVCKVNDWGRLSRLSEKVHEANGPQSWVCVAKALTPAMVVELSFASALVVEHGHLLGHAATMARELRIPCVLGCTGVFSGLPDSCEVLVDGDAGLVVLLTSPN